MQKKALFNIEIVIAVLFIALLAGLSVRKVTILKEEAQSGLSAKNLSALRDSIAVYRGDNEGACPAELGVLEPDYIEKVPFAYGTDGTKSNNVKNGIYAAAFDGSGGWIYDNEPSSESYCQVFLNTK